MDRNTSHVLLVALYIVALRKESVDRNAYGVMPVSLQVVALRKESVDRNTQRRDFKALGLPSLSARRAWIEIFIELLPWGGLGGVALRKESVDRNNLLF